MRLDEIVFSLKDGQSACLEVPSPDMAGQMLRLILATSGETEFLLRYPEEYDGFTEEAERAFLEAAERDPEKLLLCCRVGNEITAVGSLVFKSTIKERHRASIALAVLKKYWGLGIGTRMIETFAETARESGVTFLELEVMEGNGRARQLYEKTGFRITGVRPDAFRLIDGSFRDLYMMTKRL